MKVTAALTHEQGQDFVIVLVKDRVIADPRLRDEMLALSEQTFGVRATLMGETRHQTWGHTDIVRWLQGVYVEQLPWAEYTLSRAA